MHQIWSLKKKTAAKQTEKIRKKITEETSTKIRVNVQTRVDAVRLRKSQKLCSFRSLLHIQRKKRRKR